ncbi:MAG TPA: glycosyltransferase family A protein [Candidatus Paceibacterota bacterium]
MHHRFFSIVVPVYNEELLIRKALDCLVSMNYPKDRYEIIIVENGSTDATFSMVKKYESENVRVYQSAKGVSRARNFGISKCSDKMEWCIMLDADTFLKKNILNELNAYLDAHSRVDYGTTAVLLDDYTRTGRFWSWYINRTDRFIKMMHRVHIVRRELIYKVKYDEKLVSGEDLKYSRDLSKHGTYFFINTDQVITSARRFLQKGYIKMFFINMQAGLPKWLLKHADWETIR